ncbi:MAG: LemA family protein [Pirellulales bacterium]|nr:LemA family protein [Pirellulales bacterium]
MYATYAALIFCGAVVLWYWLAFNRLTQAHNAVDHAWSNIEVELNRRFDLIQNLVETAKGYARHESEVFREVAELRSQPRPFGDAAAANAAQPNLSRVIAQVMVLAENYPELRAQQSFLKLQQELTETENRIAARRHAYNQTVNLYQNLCEVIPTNIIAGAHNFAPRAFFDAPDELADHAPEVRLS